MCTHLPLQVAVYDPKVSHEQILRDLSVPKFEWDRPDYSRSHTQLLDNVQVRQKWGNCVWCMHPLTDSLATALGWIGPGVM